MTAADRNLLRTLGGRLSAGRFLDAATVRYPAVVLGATAAKRLGITDLDGNPQVWIDGRWWSVTGILEPVELASDLDTAVFVGFPAAAGYLDHDGYASALYLRADPDAVDDVTDVLGRTVNPEKPEEVEVSRPSDALAARAAAEGAFTGALSGPRRHRPRRRRTGDRERDGDLSAGAPLRDRALTCTGGDEAPHRGAVPKRVRPPRRDRWRCGRRSRRGDSPRTRAAAGTSRSRRSSSSAGSLPRSQSVPSPVSIRRRERPERHRRTRSARSSHQARARLRPPARSARRADARCRLHAV